MTGRAIAVVLLLALSGVSEHARAASPEETFDAARNAYEQGSWDAAAEGFRGLLRYGFKDWRLEYNLGNAEYKRNHLGEAILHYERARLLEPSDHDIAANLAIARAKIRDVVEEEDTPGLVHAIRSLQDRLGASTQAVVFLAGVWLIAGIVTFCASRPGGFTPGWGWTLAGAVVVTAVALGSWRATWARLDGTPRAVILKPSVEALAGPGLNNAPRFTVHEGTTATIESEREDWLQITLPNGLSGWVLRNAAERI